MAQNVRMLISSKEHNNAKSPPSHVQEWGNVVSIFQQYSKNIKYLGMVVSSTGFSAGCGAWAISNNLGLVPPFKGKNIDFARDIVLRMFERAVVVTKRILERGKQNLFNNHNYYWAIYKSLTDFSEE